MMISCVRQLPKYLLFLVGFIPLLIDRGVFFSAVAPKTLVFMVLVLGAMIATLILGIVTRDTGTSLINRLVVIFKKPMTIALGVFTSIAALATVFATDTFIAFWGNVERGDGLLTLIFLFIYFILVTLWFEKKDWLLFFKILLGVAVLVLGKEFVQALGGSHRPMSFLPNTTILAGYLLAMITSASVVYIQEQSLFWKILSLVVIVASILGIVLTETRGTILGLGAGFIALLIYCSIKGKDVVIKKYSLRMIALVLLGMGVIGSGIFFMTRSVPLWQTIPGFSRLATMSFSAGTASSRLMAWGSALESVHPMSQTKEFIIGWGPENTTLALGKYFNPLQYKFDQGIFDRTHNKFLDVFVMTGVVGLLAYLAWWFFIVRSHISMRPYSRIDAVMIFFWVSWCVHLVFIFDQNPTSLMMMVLAGFSLSHSLEKPTDTSLPTKGMVIAGGLIGVGITIIMIGVTLWGPISGYSTMRNYRELAQSKNLSEIQRSIPPLFEGAPTVQSEIRKDFLNKMTKIYGTFPPGSDLEKVSTELFVLARDRAEEYVRQRPYDFRFLSALISAYNTLDSDDPENTALETSEYYLRKMLAFAPGRPELNHNLIINLVHQERFDEALEQVQGVIDRDPTLIHPYYYKAYALAFQSPKNYQEALDLFEQSFDSIPELFDKNKAANIALYGTFFKYFYATRNRDALELVIHRLIIHNYPKSDQLIQLREYVRKGIWPMVRIL